MYIHTCIAVNVYHYVHVHVYSQFPVKNDHIEIASTWKLHVHVHAYVCYHQWSVNIQFKCTSRLSFRKIGKGGKNLMAENFGGGGGGGWRCIGFVCSAHAPPGIFLVLDSLRSFLVHFHTTMK